MKRFLFWPAFVLLISSSAGARSVTETIRLEPEPTEIVSQPPGIFGVAQAETTYFGGTVWSITNSRWEAIAGGTWTFDSGAGSSFSPHSDANPFKSPALHTRMEGWVGIDNSFTENPYIRRLQESDFTGDVCVGQAAGLGGNWSFYAGVLLEDPDVCYASPGYGDNWNVCISKEYNYNGTGNVTLTYDFTANTEPAFDYTRTIVDPSCGDESDEVVVASTTGAAAGSDNIVLLDNVDLPPSGGCIRIKFCVMSDGAYSDQDGLYPTTCGALAIDDVSVTGGGINDTDNFEAGDEGWALRDPVPGAGGEWADIRHIDSLPPLLTPCPSLTESVLVFEDFAGGHGGFQDNIAASPWIDLQAAGLPGSANMEIVFQGYFELPLLNYIFVQTAVQWYPAVCPSSAATQASPFTSDGFIRYFGGVPKCQSGANPFIVPFGSRIDDGAEEVRIALGVLSYCRFFANCTGLSNSTPWFDNVRFRVISPNVTLKAPNGGQCLSVGSNVSVTWTAVSPAGINNVDLRLSRTGPSGPFENIALGIPNTGSFSWTVTGPATTDAYIQLTTHDLSSATCTDLSNAAFTIKAFSPGTGACCTSTSAGPGCATTTEQVCCGAGGTYYGDGTECNAVTAALITEPGGNVFVHRIGPPGGCPDMGFLAQALLEPSSPPYHDGWVSDASQVQCNTFGAGPESPPIPAGFFGPGSDPFTGQVCLRGEPLGGDYQNLDTVIEREGDPFGRCELPGPDEETVMIQIVELNLLSVQPMRVTYNGGGTPEEWDVHVDLSDVPSPAGTVTAKKTHCNGGTYVSMLPVRPRFTFTLVGNPGEVHVLDTGLAGIPAVVLNQSIPQPWVSDIGILDDDPIIPQTSYFHPGFSVPTPVTSCDVNEDGINDDCQALAGPDPGIPAPLLQVSPNPFRAKTTVQFFLDTDIDARIAVFDMAGRLVRTLYSGELRAGLQSVDWNGQDALGRATPSGIYMIRIATESFVREAKVLRVQ